MATELEIVMQWRGCRVRKTVLTSVLVSSSRRVDVTTPMRPRSKQLFVCLFTIVMSCQNRYI